MNAKIPFEVVNTNIESTENHESDVGVNSPRMSSCSFETADSIETNQDQEKPHESTMTESTNQSDTDMLVEKPKKRIKAKKIVSNDLEIALSAVDALADPVEGVSSIIEEPPFETNQFEEFNLIPAVVAAIEAAGYTIPTPIQVETIPHILAGKDIIGRAETGSGKTAAFACPLLSMIDVALKTPQVLVLAPTRELAIQVTKSFEKYGAELAGFRAVTIYGGQSYEIQNSALRKGVQVVVGTPGRIMDHLRQGTLNLSTLKTIVLDEGDEMLRMGFIDDVEWILQQIPSERQTLLFSATMPGPIQKIAQNYLRRPVNVSIQNDTATAESIQQSCVLVQPRTKIDMLAQILESEETDGVIVFVKTRDTTVGIADQLSQRGFSAAAINGEIPQNQRERTIQHLKSGRLNVLVATDVAARGLDVQRISHVINFDFPHDTEAYIHRIGRTGRAGRAGSAILFVDPKEQGKLKRLQRETNQPISNYRQKSVDELNQIRIQRFKQQITDTLANSKSLGLFTKIVNEYQQETETPLEQVAVALASMAQGEAQLLLKEVFSPRSNFKSDPEKKGKRYQGEMTTFRVEVGRNQSIRPGNIVGAITNEAGLDYASIGRIKLFDDFSIIDLPTSISPKVLEQLKSVVVAGRELRITEDRRSNRTSYGRSEDRGGRDEDRGGRDSRPERSPRGEKSERTPREDRSERGPRTERSPRAERTERAPRPERRERPERSEQGTRSDRSPRSEGAARVERRKPSSGAKREFSSEPKRPFGDARKKRPARAFGSMDSKPSRSKFDREAKAPNKTGFSSTSSERKPGKSPRKFVKIRGSK